MTATIKVLDPYETLGVLRCASADEIRSAYKKLALKNHPDKVVGNQETKNEATDKFAQISSAYETLSDKQKKWQFDNIHGARYESHTSGPSKHSMGVFSFNGPVKRPGTSNGSGVKMNLGDGKLSFTFTCVATKCKPGPDGWKKSVQRTTRFENGNKITKTEIITKYPDGRTIAKVQIDESSINQVRWVHLADESRKFNGPKCYDPSRLCFRSKFL
eukprot:CAMPEP_0194358020 /NCGR_PEP_ID=MMETSP0174-20130528/5388_1 /TAXON_ID=216777 /ORGANISM="Proboscia alata, Strain PI-D3" /LENGTH=215 /DNA_ID=CAMNT_0039128239 /DNA_START=36 /DNA_END=683 /DNA_ORIENTATION=+